MSKHEEIKIGNIEVKTGNDTRFYKYGLEAIIRSENGQGWGLPLMDIKPNDLRDLADLMEKVEADLKNKDDLIVKKNDLISKLKNTGKKIRVIETKIDEVTETVVYNFQHINYQIWFKANEKLDHSFIDQLNDQNYANIETDDLTITAICI